MWKLSVFRATVTLCTYVVPNKLKCPSPLKYDLTFDMQKLLSYTDDRYKMKKALRDANSERWL